MNSNIYIESKNVEKLGEWIEKKLQSKDQKIDKFCERVKKRYSSGRNAII